MPATVRRTLSHVETTFEEGGKTVDTPTRLVAALAIIKNPWFGRGYVAEMMPEIQDVAPGLGKQLSQMILDLCGDAVEGYGKASVVGMGGELEHALAITHTVPFGNEYRDAVGAKTYLAFSNTRGAAGCPIMIPLMDKHDAGRRSHYQTIHLNVPDAPAEDEIIVALGASVGGHPNHRIGDRYADLKAMGRDVDNPTG